MTIPATSRSAFLYTLIIFNLLFLTYILAIGYQNRLSLDDYAFMGQMREHGFLSPFTFWYSNWQGRFGPQFMINAIILIYDVLQNMFFYTFLLCALFVSSIYSILRHYFPIQKIYLINFSILLFSALLLNTFEMNTFYWLNVSAMYFGGILFALIGTVFLIKKEDKVWHHLIIAFCFLFTGSSSEHVGLASSGVLILIAGYGFYESGWSVKNYLSDPTKRKILSALVFCLLAMVVMLVAPGNKIRMSAAEQVTDPIHLFKISTQSTIYVLYHIFYKLPYLMALIPAFVWIGHHMKDRIQLPKLHFRILATASIIMLLALIFFSNVPVAYATRGVGPMRSYVFITFALVIVAFGLSFYWGYWYATRKEIVSVSGILGLLCLCFFISCAFLSELPRLKLYRSSDKARVKLLQRYKEKNELGMVTVPPLYDPRYVTVTDRFRLLTGTFDLYADMTDMPVPINDVGESFDWRASQVAKGLQLPFPFITSGRELLTAEEIRTVKSKSEKAYETSVFKFYILDNYIYYQIHAPSFEKLPQFIYCRILPDKGLSWGSDTSVIFDFAIHDYAAKIDGEFPAEYQDFIFVKKQITKFPVARIETGMFDVIDGKAQLSNIQLEIKYE